jgi:hypothetical protein
MFQNDVVRDVRYDRLSDLRVHSVTSHNPSTELYICAIVEGRGLRAGENRPFAWIKRIR